MENLPYFDVILKLLGEKNQVVDKAFGRNVHWGYWDNPEEKTPTLEEFVKASDHMTDLFVEGSQLREGQSLLDVGCGFGGTIGYFNEKFSGVHFTGLNIDHRQIERAKK